MTETILGDALLGYFPLLMVFTGVVVFAIRTEGKILVLAKEIESLWRQRIADQESAKISREEIHDMLKQISAKLDRLTEKMIK